jgi:hypothetical protein
MEARSVMPFTPATLAVWLASAENVEAIATLLESSDLKLVLTAAGETVLRTHSNDILRLEVGLAPILPPSCD